ncbi:hypothetical protein H340_22001 [Streptomyces mobaraensis NBRC 13819 = DSM 40847]|uniref:Uncharacterized protein n=1 Tax=Streptomyces mobaraensis (strain ATCC 29032 / DSM 40847 / JCM 4168 / NBRC 13819 / NCIMB 11159 / IPCR 16-22) TaxID=1223523 RepID=M3C2Z2_STRM1|nr:hypothetical protein H340_22001 [Streptomyces mobaraensis NBRC 13819 = DSM 40847]
MGPVSVMDPIRPRRRRPAEPHRRTRTDPAPTAGPARPPTGTDPNRPAPVTPRYDRWQMKRRLPLAVVSTIALGHPSGQSGAAAAVLR